MADRQAMVARARRALGGRPVDEVVERARAIVGIPVLPESEKAAQAALDKLQRDDERPTAAELAALELIIRILRPAPVSRGGELPPLPQGEGSHLYPPGLIDSWESFRSAVKPYLYSVGRLDRTTGKDSAEGTGFLVAPGLVMTNRHVVDALSHGAGELDEGQSVVRFQKEYDCTEPPDATVAVLGVVAIHDTLDMALLRVADSGARPALPIASDAPDPATTVAAIGYPYKDRMSPLFAPMIFADRTYGSKRAAIGEVLESRGTLLLHDCSTLGGNSGSPVLALADARVVGLHFTGVFMYRNEAVAAPSIAEFVAAHT